MPRTRFDQFTSGTYTSWSGNVDAERAINFYPEIVESPQGKNKVAYYGTPGLTTFMTLGTSPVRALWAGEDRLFAVAGSKLYEVFAGGTATNLGDVGDDAAHTPASIWPNGHEIMIVSAGNVFIHNGVSLITPGMRTADGKVDNFGNQIILWKSGDKFSPAMAEPGNTFTIAGTTYHVAVFQNDETMLAVENIPTHTDAAYAAFSPMKAKTGTYLDSYFIINPPDSKLFYFSNPNDGVGWDPETGTVTGWDGLEVSVKEGYPDNIQAIYSDHEELWLFGTHWSTEVWRNEGDANTAGGFRRDPGAFMHVACVAPWSIVSLAQGLHFLGGDTRGRTVAFRAQGFQPVRVSTHAVEQAWTKYSTVYDAYGWTYTDNGHEFWVLNFITANATWVYDVSTQLWHERAYWNGTALEKHRGRCHAFVFGKHLVGDHTNGKIYQMSDEFFTDDGTQIRRVRRCPYVTNERKRVFHHRLELDLEVTSGNTPQINVSWTDNDGTNWTTPRVITPQVVGTNQAAAFCNRMGSSAERQYEIMISDPVKVALVDAYLDVTPGTA